MKIRSGGCSRVPWLELGTFGILGFEDGGFQIRFESKNEALGSAIIISIVTIPPTLFGLSAQSCINFLYVSFCFFLFLLFLVCWPGGIGDGLTNVRVLMEGWD